MSSKPLKDLWAFNVTTHVWRQIFPQGVLPGLDACCMGISVHSCVVVHSQLHPPRVCSSHVRGPRGTLRQPGYPAQGILQTSFLAACQA